MSGACTWEALPFSIRVSLDNDGYSAVLFSSSGRRADGARARERRNLALLLRKDFLKNRGEDRNERPKRPLPLAGRSHLRRRSKVSELGFSQNR
jgi:hypothetical protein